jgi:hypothetical protein
MLASLKKKKSHESYMKLEEDRKELKEKHIPKFEIEKKEEIKPKENLLSPREKYNKTLLKNRSIPFLPLELKSKYLPNNFNPTLLLLGIFYL